MQSIKINTGSIDLVNIGLIVLSLILAYLMPFGLFLFAYAVLGPLHYLTEINWLNERKLFVKHNPVWVALVMVTVALMSLPKVLQFLNLTGSTTVLQLIETLALASNPALVLCIWFAIVLAATDNKRVHRVGFGIGLLVFAVSFVLPAYTMVLGLLVPTLIHVYVFTVLFMLYGAKKSNSNVGYASVLLMLMAPLLILFFEVDKGFYDIPEMAKSMFTTSGFHLTNIKIGQLLGLSDGTSFFFYGSWELKLQRFIAFAYTYHYLNWFSKTAIIGWHRGIKGNRFWFIIMLWLSIVTLFLIDYRIGFYSVLGLSFLHVLLELPLNALSIRDTTFGDHLSR